MSVSAIPARPPRDQRLDLVRGWLQASIFFSHIANSFIGAWLIHRPWGLSDSSEMFVFLSGFMLGSVFTRKQARDGWGPAARDLLGRTFRLYRIHLLVCACFLLMLTVTGALLLPGEPRRLGWAYLLDAPVHALPHLLAMIYEPDWMDILPVFIWCMLALPLYAALERRIGLWALLPSVLAYLGTQTRWITSPGLTEEIGMGFDPFAWQLLFLGGAALGKRALLQGRALPFEAWWARIATGAAVLVLFLAAAGAWVARAPGSFGREGRGVSNILSAAVKLAIDPSEPVLAALLRGDERVVLEGIVVGLARAGHYNEGDAMRVTEAEAVFIRSEFDGRDRHTRQ